jgi:hypothetical protein
VLFTFSSSPALLGITFRHLFSYLANHHLFSYLAKEYCCGLPSLEKGNLTKREVRRPVPNMAVKGSERCVGAEAD